MVWTSMSPLFRTHCNFEREPLRQPFGFKGRSLRELWQIVVKLEDPLDRAAGVGLGTQSVLWSDATIFSRYSEAAANALMFQLTVFALRHLEDRGLRDLTPPQLLAELLPPTLAHGKLLTGHAGLRPTFALNALVAVDNAAWMLHAQRRKKSFDDLLAPAGRSALPHRHRQLASIPLVSYGVTPTNAAALASAGHFLLKIKLGNDPERDGDLDKMLAWDCRRLSELHHVLRDITTMHTANGRVAYYLDANGRYDSLARLKRFLEHADTIGALDRIVLLEEPFSENAGFEVRSLPVRIAADESAHSVEDVETLIQLGYGAIALKPIAKTLSLTLQMAAAAHRQGIPCFCADLTVNPVLVDWNKMVAARLPALPGIAVGVVETNGAQNYRDWPRLQSYHPQPGASWSEPRNGLFSLGDDFYTAGGAIFTPSAHYAGLVAADSSS